MRVKLTVSRGSNEGKSFEVNVPQFVIGRAKGCQLRPQSDAISRQHCVITVSDDSVTIRDLGSRNGTIVNGEKIEGTYTFSDGDDLRVGPLYLTVVIGEDVDRAPAAETETLAASSDETQSVKTPAANPETPEPMPTQAMSKPEPKKNASDSSDDIDSWLQEDDNTDNTKIGKAATQIFRLDESERFQVSKAAEEATEEKEEVDLTAKQKTKKKKEFGKLPERKEETTANSREAADATLKKMFNRGL